ncbi:MAG: hypothetical protein GY722_11870 [bacterium]|nr:hypothetical protein [bacterium]
MPADHRRWFHDRGRHRCPGGCVEDLDETNTNLTRSFDEQMIGGLAA